MTASANAIFIPSVRTHAQPSNCSDWNDTRAVLN